MIHLHLHTNYSLLQGTVRIDDLVKTCLKQNIRSIAVTDTNAMNGLIQFAKQCYEAKIKPIIGTCITEKENEKKYVIFLAKNIKGYSDICKIITQRKLNDDFSLNAVINQYWKDLILITPCIDVIEGVNKKNFLYAEIIPTSRNKKNALRTYQFAIENNIKIVASNPIYFLKKEDFEIHKLVTALRLNKTLETITNEDTVDEEYYIKDLSELEKVFIKIPEAIENSKVIAEQCKVDLKLGENIYPIYKSNNNENPATILNTIAYEGLRKKFKHINIDMKNRLDKELKVINKSSLSDYFLIVWDIVNEAKKRGMVLIGRGSAGNSLVAYCLGFTQIDPIKQNLFFERFMNSARKSPPDIDIDFSWKERDEIVKYVFEKYGYDRVAMISTTITFRARSAFRETAKAFGISEREISKYSKMIPWTNAENLPNISRKFPESRGLNFEREPWKTIVNLASKIANFPRHLSIHPSGIVITPSKITDYCALEYAKNKGLGLIITQPDMYSLEDLGLVKIDLLSQRSLGVLRDTMDVIKKNSD